MKVLSFLLEKKTYSCFQQMQLRKKYITSEWLDERFATKDIAFNVMHVMPSVLLQKPNKISEAKDDLKSLERKIDLWSKGKTDDILFDGEII